VPAGTPANLRNAFPRRTPIGRASAAEVKSGYGLNTDIELRMLRVARRLGAHSVPENRAEADYIERLEKEMMPAVAAADLAELA